MDEPKLSGRRKAAVWTLISLAAVLGLLAILATWVNRQFFDDNSWQKASKQLIQDPAIQSSLSVYLVNSLYANVDVPGAIAEKLPRNLKPFAAPAAAALRQPATDAVRLLLTRPRIQDLWIKSSTVTHGRLVNVLENKTGAGISTGNGAVTVNLGELLKSIAPDLGLPAAAADRIPPNTAVITVMRSDQLGFAQRAVSAIRVVSVWVLVLVFLMFAAALYLAAGERRKILRDIGWAFVLVGLVVLVVRRVGGNYAVNSLAPPQYRKPAHQAWVIGSSILGEIGWSVILYGLIGVLAAVLAGPHHVAVVVRRHIAPILNDKQGVAWAVVGAAYLLLILWGGTHALRTLLGILILGGLLAIGVVALRRQTLVEFPAAPTFEPAPAGGPPTEELNPS
jgi:hypothetical protein